MMIIRQFQPSDFEEIVSIETGLFQKSDPLNYISLYEISREGFLVAEVEKRPWVLLQVIRSVTVSAGYFPLQSGLTIRVRV